MKPKQKFILWFEQTNKNDIALVGGKNANLGELSRISGIKVPPGFAVTTQAFRYFINTAGLQSEVKKLLAAKNKDQALRLAAKLRSQIVAAKFPDDLKKEVASAYLKLSANGTKVAVRSSATAEDLENASFAGQQDSFLNVSGTEQVLRAIKKTFASLFSDRAVSYRLDKKITLKNIEISVGVQQMVKAKTSGVMFTIDPESGFKNLVLISAAPGLGEAIVQGSINPDEYKIFKPGLKSGFVSIISKKIGSKKIGAKKTGVKANSYCLQNKEILSLAKLALKIEQHYKKVMDIEWASDGKNFFIVQARPETVQAKKPRHALETYELRKAGKFLAAGAAIGNKIASGKAVRLSSPKDTDSFKSGNILIAKSTSPDWEPIMKKAAAIITESGGRTSHAAIICRELGIPAIIGCGNALSKIKNGQALTIDCSQGENGKIYSGKLPFSIKRKDVSNLKNPPVPLKMIIANPDLAFEYSFIPNSGIGLARLEFIISAHIGIHPNALINFAKIKDSKIKKEIARKTLGYSDKKQFYIDRLVSGIAALAAAFYPNEVVLRFSDFKSNEYAGLLGGHLYEPDEENPMLGWRGASRYYHPDFSRAFDLECQAVKIAREKLGLKNLKVMIPFCRTVEEGKKVLAQMAANGLVRGKDGLEVWVMAEVPSNIILAEEFAEIFDGFSIGSNDLTQLALGLDRDSKTIAAIGNENNKAIKKLIAELIKTAHRKGRKVGICGQAPSDFPDFAKFLINEKIDSISLNPDKIIPLMEALKNLQN